MAQETLTQNVNVAESLADMGGRLKAKRLQQAIELASISKKTQIPLKHLQSIESGDVTALPELVYVRGFVKRYAQALHLDEASFDLSVAPTSVALVGSKNKTPFMSSLGSWVKRLKYPIYALVVIGIGSGLVYLNNRETTPSPAQNSSPEAPLTSQNSSEL